METESSFVEHVPCPKCGSSDANSLYDDGHQYCFACETYTPAEGEDHQPTGVGEGLLTDLEYIPLTSRGISRESCRKYGYGIGKLGKDTVQVAQYRSGGAITAQHIRTRTKDFKWLGKSGSVELYGQHLWPSKGKRLVITEGEIDCLTIAQVFNLKWPVVSIPNGAQSAEKYLKAHLGWIEGYDEIVLAFDDDEPGRNATESCATLFTPGKVRVMSYNGHKDANELFQNDRGAVAQCVFNAKPFMPGGIVCGTELWELISADPVPGIPIIYPKLSRMIDGVRGGELYLFTAGSGIGKSTAVNEIAYDLLMTHQQVLGVMALEESVKRSSERYMGIHLNKQIHLNRKEIPKETIRTAYDEVVNSPRFWLYDHWGSTDIDVLLGKIRYMIKAIGVQWIILDHISIIVSGLDSDNNERKTIDILMTKLRSLIEETGVGVIAVVHLKRPSGQGKGFNEGRQVSLSDLRGSASLEQLSDVVVALERDQQGDDPNKSVIRVLKNRPLGLVGMADTLRYTQDTGRLLPVDEDEFGDESSDDF